VIEKFLIKDTDGKKSLTATAFVIGFMVLNFKLVCSGVKFNEFTFSQFSGVDYGAALAALGGVYVLRRNGASNSNEGKNA
jgi:hypothetical protein